MGKRIVLLSDGTGNAAAKVWRSNVWRVFESLDCSGSDQVAYYDDGVGTSAFKPLAILGGAFGWGLKRNVLDIYKFLCRNYKSSQDYAREGIQSEDDEIFAFGFSRGAFTIRVVIALICEQGLVTYTSEAELEIKIRAAYRAFRNKNFKTRWRIEWPFRFVRDLVVASKHDSTERPVQHIRFLGLWDTVAAYGLPVEEMTRGVSRYLWPLELPERELDPKVDRACHALSLDDERTTFHPLLWDESNERPPPQTEVYPTSAQRLVQVWFAGVHANVGGGYPDDALAGVPLYWIMEESAACKLRFKKPPAASPNALLRSKSAQDKDGRLYDSRSGLGGYYRYGPRDVEALSNHSSNDRRDKVIVELPKIHESALKRINQNAHLYAPIGLPVRYAVVNAQRVVLANPASQYEAPAVAAMRLQEQTHIWNLVWRRRALYFLTVFASVYLVTYPLSWNARPPADPATPLRFMTDVIALVGQLLPDIAARWLRAYSKNPVWFIEWVVLLAFLIYAGARLGSRITDAMRAAWNRSFGRPAADVHALTALPRWRFVILLAISGALLVYPFLRAYRVFDFEFLRRVDLWVLDYGGAPLPFALALFSIIYLLPTSAVQNVRLSSGYKAGVRWIKLTALPLLFVIAFVWFGFAIVNHFIFNLRDGAGHICTPTRSKALVRPREDETVTFYFDIATNQEVKVTPAGDLQRVSHGRALCFATGYRLQAGREYLFSVQPLQDTRWSFWGTRSGTGGVTVFGYPIALATGDSVWPTGFTWWKRLIMPAFYPLRRTLDRPWASIITRFGVDGNEENFIDPEPLPQKNEMQSEHLKPKRSGELFIYLNKPHFGIWGMEHWASRWIDAAGVAKVTLKLEKGD